MNFDINPTMCAFMQIWNQSPIKKKTLPKHLPVKARHLEAPP